MRSITTLLFILSLCLTSVGALAQEAVSFDSLDGDANGTAATVLTAALFKPEGVGPFPAVVAMHGCGGLINQKGKLMSRELAWGKLLASQGYVVLFPDSFGPRQIAGACGDGGPRARPWVERTQDAYGALRYLQAQSFVIADHVALMGWSHGGGVVIFSIYSGNKARPASLPKGDFRAAVAFYPGWCSETSFGGRWSTAIAFQLEMGAADDWTHAPPCVAMIQSAIDHGTPARIKVYDGAYHDFDWPGMEVHTSSPHVGKTVHTGINPEARADALVRVPAFLDEFLKP